MESSTAVHSVAEADLSPGKFVIVKSDLPVNEQASRTSPVVASLTAGALVDVVEILSELHDGRLRARIGEPAGWISLKSDDVVFARPEASGHVQFSGCATWQRTSLMIAARHGQADVIAKALETSIAQPQLDLVDDAGNTALMIAAREGHLETVKVLAAAGADPSISNASGLTAAEIASSDDIRKEIQALETRIATLVSAVLRGGASASSYSLLTSDATKSSTSTGAASGAHDVPSMVASVAAEAAAMKAASSFSSSPGRYVIMRDDVPVNEEFSRQSPKLTTLSKGIVVDIVEVPLRDDNGRIRGRLAEPAGWISLRFGKNIFAQPE